METTTSTFTTTTTNNQTMHYTYTEKPEVEMEPTGKWRNRWKSKSRQVLVEENLKSRNRPSGSSHYGNRACNFYSIPSIMLAIVLVTLVQLNQPAQALKLPAFISSWIQPQQQDGPLVDQTSGPAQALEDSMMTSSSTYEASRLPPPQMSQLTSINQQVSPKKSALHSFLMLPSKHNQLHLFSGLPRGLFGRFLTPSATPSVPLQSQAFLNPLLNWNQQQSPSSPSTSAQQMYDSSRLTGFGTGNLASVNQQQLQQMHRSPVVYSNNRTPKKHALGFGEANEFSMLDRPLSVSSSQPSMMQQQQLQQSQAQLQTSFRPQAQQQEELPQQLIIFSTDNSDTPPIETVNNSSNFLEESRSNSSSIDEFITTLRPTTQQPKQQQVNGFEDSIQKASNAAEAADESQEISATNKGNNADSQKPSSRPFGAGSAPSGTSRAPEQNADGLESSAAAIIVAPSEQVDVAPGELASDEQVESFILGPYKGHLEGSNELLGESQPLHEFQSPPQQHPLSQQQVPHQQHQTVAVQQQLHLLTGKPQPLSGTSFNRPLLSTTSLASSLIQQAKNLIHFPFAHMASNGQVSNTIGGESLRTASSATNSLFRGQESRGQLVQLDSGSATAPGRKENSANFLKIGKPNGMLSMQYQQQANSGIGESFGQSSNYQPFYNGLNSLHHNNRPQQQQQHYQHQSAATGNRLTVVGAPNTKPYFSQQQAPTSGDSGYFLMAQNQMTDAGSRQQQQQQQLNSPSRFQTTQFEFGHARQQQARQPQPYVPYFVDYTQGSPVNRKQPMLQHQQMSGQPRSPAEITFQSPSSNLLNSLQALRQQQQAQQSFHSQSTQAAAAAAVAKLASQAANVKSGLYQIEPPRSGYATKQVYKLVQQQQQDRTVERPPLSQSSPISQQDLFEVQQQMVDVETDSQQQQEPEQSQEPPPNSSAPPTKGSFSDDAEHVSSGSSEVPSAKQVAASINVSQQQNNSTQRKPGKVFNVPMASASELKTLRLSQDITLYDLEGAAEVRQEHGKPQVGFLDTEVHTVPYMLSMQPSTGRVQHTSPPARFLHFNSQHPQQHIQHYDTLPLGRFPLGYLPPPAAQPAVHNPFENLYQELEATKQQQQQTFNPQQSLYQKASPAELSNQLIRVEQQQAINYSPEVGQRGGEHQFVLAIDHQNGSPQGVSSLLAASMVAPGSVTSQLSSSEQPTMTSTAPVQTTINEASLLEASTSAAPPSSEQPTSPGSTTTRTPEENTDNNSQENLDTGNRASTQPSLPGAGEPSSPSSFCADRTPGLYADESQRCKAYYQCAPTGHQMFRCNNHTQFNQKTQNCDWWYNVNCGGQQQQQPEQQSLSLGIDDSLMQLSNASNEKPAHSGEDQVSSSQDRVTSASAQADISNFKQDSRWTVASDESIHSLQASSENPTTVTAPETTSFSPQTSVGDRTQPGLSSSQSSPQDLNEFTVRLDSTSTTEIAPSTNTQSVKETESPGLQVGTLSNDSGDSTRMASSTTSDANSRVQISLTAEGATSATSSSQPPPSTTEESAAQATGNTDPATTSTKRLVQSEFGSGAKHVEPESGNPMRANLTSANQQSGDQRSAAIPEALSRRRYERRYGERISKT